MGYHFSEQIEYSEKYNDDTYEYRHVTLPENVFANLKRDVLLTEDEWRTLGLQMSTGWEHYLIFKPEPFVMLFRRPLNYQFKQNHQNFMQ
eukprot:403364962